MNGARSFQSCSRERQSHLESLLDFVSQATQELIWLNEKEEEEVAFDWSDRNSSISKKRDYHAVSPLMNCKPWNLQCRRNNTGLFRHFVVVEVWLRYSGVIKWNNTPSWGICVLLPEWLVSYWALWDRIWDCVRRWSDWRFSTAGCQRYSALCLPHRTWWGSWMKRRKRSSLCRTRQSASWSRATRPGSPLK